MSVKRFGYIGSLIDELLEEFQKGNIKLCILAYTDKDGGYHARWTDGRIFELSGMALTIAQDIHRSHHENCESDYIQD